jgi:hypothetical protein
VEVWNTVTGTLTVTRLSGTGRICRHSGRNRSIRMKINSVADRGPRRCRILLLYAWKYAWA